ncbi:MAG: putative ATP-grasp-modified RiPP [Pseudonocardiaceae bacterium]
MTSTENTWFFDDPLAPVSAQFPLTRPGLATADNTESPSAAETRPFGLRHVRAMPEPVVPAYDYCHEQQVSVADDDNGEPMVSRTLNMEWSSISDNEYPNGSRKVYGPS